MLDLSSAAPLVIRRQKVAFRFRHRRKADRNSVKGFRFFCVRLHPTAHPLTSCRGLAYLAPLVFLQNVPGDTECKPGCRGNRRCTVPHGCERRSGSAGPWSHLPATRDRHRSAAERTEPGVRGARGRRHPHPRPQYPARLTMLERGSPACALRSQWDGTDCGSSPLTTNAAQSARSLWSCSMESCVCRKASGADRWWMSNSL